MCGQRTTFRCGSLTSFPACERAPAPALLCASGWQALWACAESPNLPHIPLSGHTVTIPTYVTEFGFSVDLGHLSSQCQSCEASIFFLFSFPSPQRIFNKVTGSCFLYPLTVVIWNKKWLRDLRKTIEKHITACRMLCKMIALGR